MDKTELYQILSLLPVPLVGGFCFDDNQHPNIRDSCLEMIKDVISISNPKEILEIGTHCGGSAMLLLALSNSNLSSVDIAENWICMDASFDSWDKLISDTNHNEFYRLGKLGGLKLVIKILQEKFGRDRFRFIMGDSTNRVTINKFSDRKYDLIFIDGNHDYEYCKKDVETALELKIPYILLDDFNDRDETDARIRVSKEFNLTPIKTYQSIHNCANIGCGFFKNPNV